MGDRPLAAWSRRYLVSDSSAVIAAGRARELCSQWLVGRSHRITEQHDSINAP